MTNSLLWLPVIPVCVVAAMQSAGEEVGGIPELPLAQQATAARAYAKPTLPVADWQARYERVEAREWAKRWNGGIHGGWFGGDKDEVAKAYLTTWGPLGIRTYMHDRTWTSETAFVRRAPEILKTAEGELFVNCFEVVDVFPGSPAEGQLQEGDLIVGMEQQLLRSAQQVDTPEPWHHKASRSLALQAGILLDEAEGRGELRLNVLRNPRPFAKPDGTWKVLAERKFWHHGNKPPAEFEVDIPGGQEARLVVADGGNGIGSDGFEWRSLMLEGGGRRMALHELKGVVHRVGYGRPTVDEKTSNWAAHSNSEIRFRLPEGHWTLTALGAPVPPATVVARIETRTPLGLPKSLVSQTREIVIPLAKMGTFAGGLPGACVKTANIIAQQSAWLATQQQDDGSWQRPHGYTGNHYDTAWAGLGLMATGDTRFDSQVRKAAEFLAFKAKPDGWAVPSSAVAIFLGEYWLRYRDDRILPALEGWVNCLLTESLTGDYTAGHGHNPGYRGTGVSTGGSHAAAAFAVASKTPVHFDTTLLDRMLSRVQQLAPDGHVPYGRGRGRVEFQPALTHGATYSGRHGPYLVASLLHGGPRLFTENCTRMYAEGPKGGSDQGHATETLSNQWAFIAMAASDLDAYREHLSAMRWKITMRRCFDGGFCQSAFRLEYAGGEGLLDYAIRCGSWLVSLCAEKQNLAITGAPAYRAKSLVDLPPVQHVDAMLHGCYLRDWAVVDAVLGDRSPESLRTAITGLQSLRHDPELRQKLALLLPEHAMSVAREVAAIDSLEPRLRCYLVEMLLGMNIRVDAVGVADQAGHYEIHLDQEFPLAGLELDPERLAVAGAGVTGSVSFTAANGIVPVPAELELDPATGVKWSKWHSKRSTVKLEGPKEEPFELTATFDYRIGDIPLRYQRQLLFNQGEDYGNGEKQRKVINDRRVWVPGTLSQDHARWNISFRVPSDVWIAAATQGNEILVHEGDARWISPRDQSLPMGSQGEFCYTSGWQRWEARVPEFRLNGGPGLIGVTSIVSGREKAPENMLLGEGASFPLAAGQVVEIALTEAATLRAFDLRADKVGSIRIEAESGGTWQTIHLGRPGDLVKRPVAVETARLRIHLEDVKPGAELKLLRLYR